VLLTAEQTQDFLALAGLYLLALTNRIGKFVEQLVLENVSVETEHELRPVSRKELYKRLLSQ
jgi:hypothetical protein